MTSKSREVTPKVRAKSSKVTLKCALDDTVSNSKTVIYPFYEFGGHKLVWAPPAFANGRVFARSEAEFVCASLSGK